VKQAVCSLTAHSAPPREGKKRTSSTLENLNFDWYKIMHLISNPMTQSAQFKFSTVPGFFLQDEPDTDPATFDYVRGKLDFQIQRWITHIPTIQFTNSDLGRVQFRPHPP
jgi:hypothetical protein